MFVLDKQLSESSFFVADWPLSMILLKDDGSIPWFILVPKRPAVRELYQLNEQDQMLLIREINQLSQLLTQYYQPKKLNVATLGNIVEQLHIHCVVRTEQDPMWPQGVWQASYASQPYIKEQLPVLISSLQRLITPYFK